MSGGELEGVEVKDVYVLSFGGGREGGRGEGAVAGGDGYEDVGGVDEGLRREEGSIEVDCLINGIGGRG